MQILKLLTLSLAIASQSFEKWLISADAGWDGFNTSYTDNYMLEPTDPMFVPLGAMYTKMLIEEFGTNDNVTFYNADT
jgi:hypothetical protein